MSLGVRAVSVLRFKKKQEKIKLDTICWDVSYAVSFNSSKIQ